MQNAGPAKKGHPLIMGKDIHAKDDKCPERRDRNISADGRDTPEGIKKRLEVYKEETIPVVENFRERELLIES